MECSSLIYVDRFSPAGLSSSARSARSASPDATEQLSPRDLLQQRINESPFLNPFLGFGIAAQAEREFREEQLRIDDARWSTSAADTNAATLASPSPTNADARWSCPMCKTRDERNILSHPNGSRTCTCGCVLEEQTPISLARQKNCPEDEDNTRTADDPDVPKSRFLHALGIESADDARKRRLRETDLTRIGKQKAWPPSTSTNLASLESLDSRVESNKDARRAAARAHAQATKDCTDEASALDETRLRALSRSLETILNAHFPAIHSELTKQIIEAAQLVLENADSGLIAKSRVAALAIAILQHVLGRACADIDSGNRLGEVPNLHVKQQLTIALQLKCKSKTAQAETLKSAVAAALGQPLLPLSPLSSFKPRPVNSPASSPTLTASSTTSSSAIGSPPMLCTGLKSQNASTSSLDGAFVSLTTHCASNSAVGGAARSLSAPPPSDLLHLHDNDSGESDDEGDANGEFPAADDDEDDAHLF